MNSIEEIKPQLLSIMKLIVNQFGNECEVVLHDHTKGLDHCIVAIENGHVTNRKVGDGSTNIGFEIHKKENQEDIKDQYGYITNLRNGKTIRSSSMYFKNDQGKVIGAMCINFDITNLIKVDNYLSSFTSSKENENVNEIITSNVSDILDYLINEYTVENNVDPKTMTKQEMLSFLTFLDSKGVFLIRNSAPKICDLLGISKYTLYAYLKEANLNHKKN